MLVSRLWPRLAPFVLGLGAITIFFAPTIAAGSKQVPFFFPDGWVSLWAIDWCFQALLGRVELYWSNSIFEPVGASLLLHNLTESICLPGSLLLEIAPLERTYAAIVYLVFVSNYLAAYLLFRKISGNQFYGAALGTIYSLHPYFLGHLAGGHLNQVVSFPMILLVLALVNLRERQTKYSNLVFIAAIFAFIVFTDLYLLYFAGAVLLLFSLFVLGIKETLRPIAWASLGILIGTPKLLGVINLIREGSYTANHHPLDHSLDLLSFCTPSPVQAISIFGNWSNLSVNLRPSWAESSAYLGIAGIFIILGSIRAYKQTTSNEVRNDRPLLLAAGSLSVLFLVLSFGPMIHIAGTTLSAPMPYHYLFQLLPFFPSVPARFFHPALLMLFVAAAVSIPRSSRIFGALWLAVAIFEFCPSHIFTTEVPQWQALTTLAQNIEVTRVIDTGSPEKSMYRQTRHRKELVGGFLARRPRAFKRLIRDNAFFTMVDGRSNDSSSAMAGLLRLGAQAVMVEKQMRAKLDRVQSLTFLKLCAEDDDLAIFCLEAVS